MRSRFLTILLTATGLTAAGCSGPDDRPEIVPVEGVVTYRGEPVEGARVKFFLAESPRPAVGITDDEGRYALSTFEEGDGAVLGEHQVTIFKRAAPRPAGEQASAGEQAAPDPAGGPDVGAGNFRQMAQMLKERTRSMLPQKYADPKTSGLVRAVTSEGDHQFDFVLEDE